MRNPSQLNGSVLAYIGDAYYELLIRDYFVQKGETKMNTLHRKVIHYTNAKSHSVIVKELLDKGFFTQEEILLFKKGRNSKTNSVRKSASLEEYSYSTGFECIIGYNYLVGNINRVNEIVNEAILILK